MALVMGAVLEKEGPIKKQRAVAEGYRTRVAFLDGEHASKAMEISTALKIERLDEDEYEERIDVILDIEE